MKKTCLVSLIASFGLLGCKKPMTVSEIQQVEGTMTLIEPDLFPDGKTVYNACDSIWNPPSNQIFAKMGLKNVTAVIRIVSLPPELKTSFYCVNLAAKSSTEVALKLKLLSGFNMGFPSELPLTFEDGSQNGMRCMMGCDFLSYDPKTSDRFPRISFQFGFKQATVADGISFTESNQYSKVALAEVRIGQETILDMNSDVPDKYYSKTVVPFKYSTR